MSLVQRLLFAIRTLLEDDPPPKKKKRSTSRYTTKQAVALVITFRDLFNSGNLNIILEDIENNKVSRSNNGKYYRSSSRNRLFIGQPTATSSPIPARIPTIPETLNSNRDLVPVSPVVWPSVLDGTGEAVPLLHEEKIISSPLADFQSFNSIIKRRVISGSQEIVPYVRAEKRSTDKHFTVALSPESEKETAAVLRKVLKWSPRKQNAVTFAVPLPKEEEHKAVAVVQNAVNLVKEENIHKKKRKWKNFKLTFC